MDDLKFFGRGSGFNPAMGSTAAYFIEGNCLFVPTKNAAIAQLLVRGRTPE